MNVVFTILFIMCVLVVALTAFIASQERKLGYALDARNLMLCIAHSCAAIALGYGAFF